jgi:hypothetical protein
MKHLIRFLLMGLLLAACQRVNNTVSAAMLDDVNLAAYDWAELSEFEQNLVPEAFPVLEQMQDAPYYLMDITLDNTLQSVKGRLAVHYTNTSTDELPYIVFQLFTVVYGGSVMLGEVSVDQKPVNLDVVEDGTVIHVLLETPLKPGKSIVIDMPFESSIPREMGGNYGLYGYFEDVLVLDGFYPLLAVYDEGIWHTNITSPNGDIKYEEMSLYQVWLSAPAELSVINSGTVVSQQESKGTQTLQMVAGPVREFYLAASEKYLTHERMVDGVKLLSTGVEGTEDTIEYALDIGEASLQSYTARFGAYPYSELDIVSTPMQALGMEYPGVSTLAISLYGQNSTDAGMDRDMLDSVIAHEIGHQWFFNLVGSDQIEEPWLDESMTQYIVGLFYEDTYGESAAEEYRESWNGRWSSVDYAEMPIGRPSYAYEGSEYSAIVYGRGPYFLMALQDSMGEAAFAQAMKTYFETYEWKIATGADFQEHMQEACGCDLSALFEGWVAP